MSRVIRIPFPYRPCTGGTPEVSAEGATARELLAALTTAYPALRRHLLTDAGGLRGTVHLFVNGRELTEPDEQIGEAGTVELVPSVAGGGGRAHDWN